MTYGPLTLEATLSRVLRSYPIPLPPKVVPMDEGPVAYPDHDTVVLLGIVDLTDEELASWVFTLEEILDLPQTR